MRTESDFIGWLSGASIYIGYARYAQFGHSFVCTSQYDHDDELQAWTEDLDGGDNDAISAANAIRHCGCWIGANPNPAVAMTALVGSMRRYYFDVLSGGGR